VGSRISADARGPLSVDGQDDGSGARGGDDSEDASGAVLSSVLAPSVTGECKVLLPSHTLLLRLLLLPVLGLVEAVPTELLSTAAAVAPMPAAAAAAAAAAAVISEADGLALAKGVMPA
jgi:hypothetical protein